MDQSWTYRTDIIDGPTRSGQIGRDRERIDLPLLFDTSSVRVLYPFDPSLEMVYQVREGIREKGPLQEEIEKALERARGEELKTGIGVQESVLSTGREGSLHEVEMTSDRLAGLIMGDPFAVSRILSRMKEITAPPLYLPGGGSSDDLEVLYYLGVEIFDTSRARMDAFRKRFYTMNSWIPSGGISPGELCSCDACREMIREGISDRSVAEHNVMTITRRLAMAHLRLKEGRLREHVMGMLSGNPDWMSVLRNVERSDSWDILSRASSFRRIEQVPVTYRDDLHHPDFRLWRKRIREEFQPLPHKRILLLLPCSASKPYSGSRTHARISRSLSSLKDWKTVCQRLVLTSPLGAVPMEIEDIYPASYYDIPVTGSWFDDEVREIRDLTFSILEKGQFQSVICYHKDGGRFFPEEIENGLIGESEMLDVHSIAGSEGSSPGEMLGKLLAREMIGPEDIGRNENTLMEVSKMMEFSLAWRIESFDGINIRRTRRGTQLRKGREPLFDLARGGPVPTLSGARMIWESGMGKRVIIDDFTPKGTLFSQGALKVIGDIRPGDIVLMGTEEEFKAYGRALIPGDMMISKIPGKAVKVQNHVR